MNSRTPFRILTALALAAPASAQCLHWGNEFSNNSPSGFVYALASHDDGSGSALFVGGAFSSAGGVPASHIAKWDGTNWSALGAGVDALVESLAVFDEGTGAALFAGGSFTTAGGAPALALARWRDSSWTAVPGLYRAGPQGPVVIALLAHDFGAGPVLYVGGSFDGADLAASSNVVAWDGAAWSSIGGGVSGGSAPAVQCLAVFDDGGGPALYVGGRFTMAGAVPANNIAKWDGTGWSSLGTGAASPVRALAVYDEGSGPALFAAGDFSAAAGSSATQIARWDGSSWSSLGAEPSSTVRALTVFDDGSGPGLYAGGHFLQVDGSSAKLVARWDGIRWSALGSGLSHHWAEALAVHDDLLGGPPDLYVGGDWVTAGSQLSRNLAKWNACAAPVDTFCFGGMVAACPCVQPSGDLRGCGNSNPGGLGAVLGATGNPSLAGDTLVLHAADERPSALTIFLQGDELIPGTVPFGDGLRCTGGALKRLYVKNAVQGAVDAPLAGDPSISARSAALGDPLAEGDTRYYMTYYRDPDASFCPSGTFNSTNGVRVVWQQ